MMHINRFNPLSLSESSIISFQFSITFPIDDEFNKVKEIVMIVGITVGSILLLLILITLIILGIAVARLVHKRYVNMINFVFACQ